MDGYRIGEAAKLLGVRVETLRTWERAGKLKTNRTTGGQRIVPQAEVARIMAAGVWCDTDRAAAVL